MTNALNLHSSRDEDEYHKLTAHSRPIIRSKGSTTSFYSAGSENLSDASAASSATRVGNTNRSIRENRRQSSPQARLNSNSKRPLRDNGQEFISVQGADLNRTEGWTGEKKEQHLSLKDSASAEFEKETVPAGDGGKDAMKTVLCNGHATDQIREVLCKYVFKNVVGYENIFQGPWGRNFVTYLDYVASGRPLRCIESYIRNHVLPTYANTHTEVSFCAQQTTLFREEARSIIKECINASKEDAVIFTGSGSTSAVHKLIHVLNPSKPIVFIGPYEHHSNILPWLEIGAKVVRIRQTKDGLVDIFQLSWELKRLCNVGNRTIIGSFSAASNVTGILTDTDTIAAIMHRHNGIAFFDFACAGPYVDIDMNPVAVGKRQGLVYKDAIFISPHKFVGGPGTPGILVAKRHLFRHPVPHGVGGGTVIFVRRKAHRYLHDPEHKEEGGTPAIIESIRAGLVFKLKQTFSPRFIMEKDEAMFRKARLVWSRVKSLVILGNMNAARLPIFPLLFYNRTTGRLLHHDFVAMVLNDVFGIQVRSGCACAAPYGLDLMGLSERTAKEYERLVTGLDPSHSQGEDARNEHYDNVVFKPGFVRLNLPYFMPEECFNFVLNAIEMVAENGWALLPQYGFDRKTGRWHYKDEQKVPPKKRLVDVTFHTGKLVVNGLETTPREDLDKTEEVAEDTAGEQTSESTTESNSKSGADESGSFSTATQSSGSESQDSFDYVKVLQAASLIFQEALSGSFDEADQTQAFKGAARALRWFMLPSEAADIIHNRQVTHLKPEELPFMPGALARRLGITAQGHPGRSNSMDRLFPVEY